jgi:phosphoglycolate phosphatase
VIGCPGSDEERAVSEAPKITLTCLGLAGTAVDDRGLFETAFAEALAVGIVAGTVAFDGAMTRPRESRGRPNVEIFRQLFPGGAAGSEAWAQTANLSFERSYDAVATPPATGCAGGEPVPPSWPAC